MTVYWFKARVIWEQREARSETLDAHIVARTFDEAKHEFEHGYVARWSNIRTAKRVEIREAKVVMDYVVVAPIAGPAERNEESA